MKRLFYFFILITTLSACSKEKSKKALKFASNSNSDKAYEYRNAGKTDSAFKYFSLAKDEFLLLNDSVWVANSMVNMAIIATDRGDYFGGQEISLNTFKYLNENNKNHRSYVHSNYNNLGVANYHLRNYQTAIRFYNQALWFVRDRKNRLAYLNNKAKVYEELKNYDKAIIIYSKVLRESQKETTQYAQALANLASTKWHQNSSYNAAPELLYALHIYSKEGDSLGLNLCYARLADLYSKRDSVKALYYAEKMYRIAQDLRRPKDQLEALYKLIKLGPSIRSKEYFVAYEKLDDSLKMSVLSDKNQFALIRYDTLKLEKDNTEKKYELIWQKAILSATLIIVFLVANFLLFWYKKRKKTHQQEKELEVKNIELKYVKKVHDRVANKVYSVMMEVENSGEFNKTTLADKLESIYKISRDISYENNDVDGRIMFAQQLKEMLISYASNVINISINGNEEDIWQNVDEFVKSEIMVILQELMTNMVKHSQATIVQFDFKRKSNRINISYLDNGIGIIGVPIFKNGLTNTGNRIKEINGIINFDITVQKGLKIEISFPVS